MGTVGEHPGFPIESLSLSHCGRWLASCSHDQTVKFSDVGEVLSEKVDGHRRARRGAEQRKVLSSKAAAELDFFGDLDPDKKERSPQRADGGNSSSEDGSSDSESDTSAGTSCGGKGSEGGRGPEADSGPTAQDEVGTDGDSDSSLSQEYSDDDDNDN